MSISLTDINNFITTKVLPFFAAILAALPPLVTSNVADFQVAAAAVLKLVGDFQSDVSAFVAAVKSAT